MSATECQASDSIAAEPVNPAATNFATAMSPFPANAATTAVRDPSAAMRRFYEMLGSERVEMAAAGIGTRLGSYRSGMWAPPSLTSPRLALSNVGEGDRMDIFDGYARDPEVTRYLSWTPRTDIGQVDEFIADRLQRWDNGESFAWVLRLRASNELVGMVEARVDLPRIELGYAVVRRFWGKGLATEAVRAVVDWAAAEPAVRCVWGYADVDNGASIRVLEKAGLSRAGLLEGWAVHPNIAPTPRDCYIYSRRFD